MDAQTDYLSNPRETLETLANLHRQAGMRPEQSDQLAEILKVVGDVTNQLDRQEENSTVTEVASKAA